MGDRGDALGIGANWGRAPNGSGAGGRDQYTFESYYRLQRLPQLALTADVQYVVNPAAAPEQDGLWVLGIRRRAVF